MADTISTFSPSILYSTNLGASVSASGAAAGYPATNLLDYSSQIKWVAPDTGTQRITWNLGTTQYVQYIGVIGHDLWRYAADGNMVVTGSTSSDFTTGNQFVTTCTLTSGLDNSTANNVTIWQLSSSMKIVQYLSLQLGGLADGAAVQIGCVFFNTAISFDTPYELGYNTENAEYQTAEKVALNGVVRTAQAYKGRILYELRFATQSDALRTAFQAFHRGVQGRLYPFIFQDDDGTCRYMHVEDYVPVTRKRYGQSDINTLRMRTHESIY